MEGCDMDGSGAIDPQFYGVSAGGSQSLRSGSGETEKGQNQETIRVVNNVFRNMACTKALVYLTPWDVKDVEIVGNTLSIVQ